MKTIQLAICAAIVAVGTAHAQLRTLGIEEARNQRVIEYQGDVNYQTSRRKLKLKIKNRSRDSVSVNIETGRIFMPTDHQFQPLIVTRGKTIKLGPKQSRDIHVSAVCGNAPKRSANDGSTQFNMSEMTNVGLQNVLNYLVENKIDVVAPVQNVIWTFTNKHQLGSIVKGDMSEEAYMKLMTKIAEESGRAIPWYNIFYQPPPEDSDMLFTGKAIRIEGKVKYILHEKEDIHIVVRDMNGELVRKLKYINQQSPGEYKMPMEVDVSSLPAGNYKVNIESSSPDPIASYMFNL
jgi:hypothetical protein